jgi:heme-degrading monooxygenase HmoA
MMVVVFRSKVRAGASSQDAMAKGMRMYELASAMPGFISYKEFAHEDGETVSIVEFESAEHLSAWREHPEHLEVQRWGREQLFESYQVQVCELVRVSRWSQLT